MTSIRHVGLVMLALALVGPACGEEPSEPGTMCPGPGEERATESIDFLAVGHDFQDYCEANFEAAESHAAWVANAWDGGEPPRFFYHLFESRDDPCWPCGKDNGIAACASSRRVATTTLPHRHETAHAVRGLPCFPLIEEGWAMLYGDHFQRAGTVGDIRVALDSLDSLDSGSWLKGEHYPLATRFVAFLLETRGVAKLRELCELPHADVAQFEDAVITAYGQTFDDLALEFETYPEWTLSELRQDQACESGDVLVSPASWNHTMGCGEEGVEGQSGDWVVAQRLVELPEAGAYTFTFSTNSSEQLSFKVELRNCERDGLASIYFIETWFDQYPNKPHGLLLLDFEAGTYVVRIRVDEPTEGLELAMSVDSWF